MNTDYGVRRAGAERCMKLRRCIRSLRTLPLIAIAAGVCVRGATAAEVAHRPLLAEAPLARRLQQPVTLAWTGQELRSALARLSEVQGVPIWLDRRVDPNAELNLSASNQPIAAVLDQLTADPRGELGWTTLRNVVYVGPRDAARELATLSELARQALAKAPADVRRKWLTPSAWTIPRLSEPRKLLDETLAAVDAKLQAGATIPHDVWAECALPGIAPIDRVVLMLAGFDLAVEPAADGGRVRVSPIKRPIELRQSYPASERVDHAVAELASADDGVRVRRQGRQVAVAGSWEDHERIRLAQRGVNAQQAAPPATSAGRSRGSADQAGGQRFTLRIASKPVGPVLAQLAAQLQLTVEWDAALTAAMPAVADTLVSCEVREVDLDGLLSAILESAGLTFDRNGQRVTIRAAN
jgi:hypothetical protein